MISIFSGKYSLHVWFMKYVDFFGCQFYKPISHWRVLTLCLVDTIMEKDLISASKSISNLLDRKIEVYFKAGKINSKKRRFDVVFLRMFAVPFSHQTHKTHSHANILSYTDFKPSKLFSNWFPTIDQIYLSYR